MTHQYAVPLLDFKQWQLAQSENRPFEFQEKLKEIISNIMRKQYQGEYGYMLIPAYMQYGAKWIKDHNIEIVTLQEYLVDVAIGAVPSYPDHTSKILRGIAGEYSTKYGRSN